MASTQVWQGLDRRSFFENAILFELKHRSQGDVVRTPAGNLTNWITASQDGEIYLDGYQISLTILRSPYPGQEDLITWLQHV